MYSWKLLSFGPKTNKQDNLVFSIAYRRVDTSQFLNISSHQQLCMSNDYTVVIVALARRFESFHIKPRIL